MRAGGGAIYTVNFTGGASVKFAYPAPAFTRVRGSCVRVRVARLRLAGRLKRKQLSMR